MTGKDNRDAHSDDNGDDRSTQFLANERTFLAWTRTAIALIGLGFIVSRFELFLDEFRILVDRQVENTGGQMTGNFLDDSFSSILGLSTVVLGIALILSALRMYRDGQLEIQKKMFVPKSKLVHTTGIAFIALGIAIAAYLLMVSLN